MLATRLSRSVPSSTLRSLRFYSQQPPNPDINGFVDQLLVDDMSGPPTAPSNGYPPAQPPPSANPFKESKKLESKVGSIVAAPQMYHVHCHSSRNNTITTLTRPNGTPVAWFSGGSCGFKKGNRASYEAGYQCAVRMFERVKQEVEEKGKLELQLVFKGFGQGRDALHRAIMTSEGEFVRPLVKSIVDKTPIKIGGTRSPKARRL
ncbi:hypothetical protein ONZ45_g4553 [Pleurotus djamor]|nr:hypothetical protein ONZ45_g4553 [Pleurotus djamor]